jgi:rhodanese-related sulfurtransferase
VRDIERQEVRELSAPGAQLVEVLGREEFDEDHLPGAINIPLRKIETQNTNKLDKQRAVIVYCWDSA